MDKLPGMPCATMAATGTVKLYRYSSCPLSTAGGTNRVSFLLLTSSESSSESSFSIEDALGNNDPFEGDCEEEDVVKSGVMSLLYPKRGVHL